MDTALLKTSFQAVAGQAEEVVEYFYAHLFATGGQEVIDMFPPLMVTQRDRLLRALVQIVTSVDDLDILASYLGDLGRDHRKYNVRPEHFGLVGASLLATLAQYAGEDWTPEVAETWRGAYALISQVMIQALTTQDGTPHWWEGVVTAKEQPCYDIAKLSVRLLQPMAWVPGQSVAVMFEDRPRIWRYLTPANAPRPTREMELHVKVVPGGLLSAALALEAEPGSRLRLGPPLGALQLDETSRRNILMVAGSTGLAPMLAMIDRLAARQDPPDVQLFFGAREPDGLYELDRLLKLVGELDWLALTHAVSGPPQETGNYDGEHGSIVDIAAHSGPWGDRDAYICGSSAMVQATRGRLVALGTPESQIHIEDFGWEG